MSQNIKEKIALVVSVGIILTATWFWFGQLQSVLDLLEMAYG